MNIDREQTLDPHRIVVQSALQLSGVMPSMLKRNPELDQVLHNFFLGDKPILIVGGESGMGKSLFASDIRQLQPIINDALPSALKSPLAVVSWDRVHDTLFNCASHPYGERIPLPKGETYKPGRVIASYALADAIRYVRRTLPKYRVLVETPLFGSRGENLHQELANYQTQMQTVIMVSAPCRQEILTSGIRSNPTSGQVEAMHQMREKLLRSAFGRRARGIADNHQDELLTNWWKTQMAEKGGIVIEWDPNDDRAGYKQSVEVFRSLGITSEKVQPSPVGQYIANQLEIYIASQPKPNNFLTKLANS